MARYLVSTSFFVESDNWPDALDTVEKLIVVAARAFPEISHGNIAQAIPEVIFEDDLIRFGGGIKAYHG